MPIAQIELPPKLIPIFSRPARNRCAWGGRGSAKTRSFALMTAVEGYRRSVSGESGIILCGREYMNSLDESSMEEIKQAVRSVPWLEAHYEIGEKFIRTRDRRIEYRFAGLRHNLDSIKSKARILIAWIDEAEQVQEIAWRKLLPTIRENTSEVWVTWNPEREDSPTNQRFRINPPTDYVGTEINWTDNPWFPEALNQQRLDDQRRLDPNTYAHVWEGAYLEHSDAQVFANKFRVDEFEPDPETWDGPYYGLDFGFSQDPTAGIRAWVADECLWVDHDCTKTGLELDDTADYLHARIPGIADHVVRADSARPESISYLRRHGIPRITGVSKGKGSVEDGVAHIRGFRQVIIHPRCQDTIREFRLYSYKVDRLTGDVLPVLVDANNHCIDALRYALEPMIKQRSRPRLRRL